MLLPAGSAAERVGNADPTSPRERLALQGAAERAGGRAVSLLRTANFSEFSAKWEGRRCPEEGRERGAGAEGAVYGPALCWGPWLPGARPRAQFAVGSAKNAPCQTGGLVRSEGKISKWWCET